MDRYLTTAVLVFVLSSAGLAGVIHVPGDQPNIQAGIDAATNGDTVLVAANTYYENINFKGKAIVVASHFLTDADPNHITTTIINGSQPSNPDSASVVYFVSGEDTTSVLYGFTITGGTGTSTQQGSRTVKGGGGIFIHESSASILHNHIKNNSLDLVQNALGGGIYSYAVNTPQHVIIEYNQVTHNLVYADAWAYGGGIDLETNGRIAHNRISENSCYSTDDFAGGGGLEFYHQLTPTTVIITYNTITHNTVYSRLHGAGGGGIEGFPYDVYVINNHVSHNEIFGGDWSYGGGIYIGDVVNMTLVKNNNISFNKHTSVSANGGGLNFARSTGVTVEGNILQYNEALRGGGFRCINSSPLLINNIITNNTARYGGGIFLDGHSQSNLTASNSEESHMEPYRRRKFSAQSYESAHSSQKASLFNWPQIINNTIADNVGYVGGGLNSNGANPVVVNSIFWGNSAPYHPSIFGALDIVHSDIEGGGIGTGNIDTPPFLHFPTYELSTASTCIGAGIDSVEIRGAWHRAPAIDIAGNARPSPIGSSPDIGAYESPLDTTSGPLLVPEQYPSIQAGINAAADGDVVLVNDNTYYEQINFKGKAITVASYFYVDGDSSHIDSTVIDGSQSSHPDSGSVVYFVSGEDTTSVLQGFTITGGTGTINTIMDLDMEWISRSGGGIFCFNSGASIINNKIINNNINATSVGTASGGGIVVYAYDYNYDFDVIIQGNHILNNTIAADDFTFSGAIDMICSGKVMNNIISHNASIAHNGDAWTGGMFCYSDTVLIRDVVICNNQITHNTVTSNVGDAYHGAIRIHSTHSIIKNNTISYNEVNGAINANGGGIGIMYQKNASIFHENIVEYNVVINATGVGGGLRIAEADPIITNNTISNNAAARGGGIACTTCSPTIQNNIISDNSSSPEDVFCGERAKMPFNETKVIKKSVRTMTNRGRIATNPGPIEEISLRELMDATNSANQVESSALVGQGGGIRLHNSSPSIINNIISGNATTYGGGVYHTTHCDAEYINNTIVNNTATASGGGIYCLNSDPVIINTIVWANESGSGSNGISVISSNVNVAYSNIQDGWSGTGNISLDPLFVAGDSLFHLSDSSRCIGAGINSVEIDGIWYHAPTTDFEGNQRPNPAGSMPDMGACESALELPTEVADDFGQPEIPKSFVLEQNYPNPFNPLTTIKFSLPKKCHVILKVYNNLGEEVTSLVSGVLLAGNYQYILRAENLASGIYFYRLTAGDFVQKRKMLLLK